MAIKMQIIIIQSDEILSEGAFVYPSTCDLYIFLSSLLQSWCESLLNISLERRLFIYITDVKTLASAGS